MTNRDELAEKALMALLAGNESISMTETEVVMKYPEAFVRFSYVLADKMIAERKKE